MDHFSDDQIIVALASDESFFPGLFVAVISVLLSTKTQKDIIFHILDSGISDDSWNKMIKTSQNLKSNSYFVRISNIDISKVFEGVSFWRGKYHTYLRVLLPDLIKSKQIIYLDSDILFGRDIEELWEMDFEDNTLIAVGDAEAPTQPYFSIFDINFRNNATLTCDSLYDLYNVPKDSKYFNAGILKINLQPWINEKITEKFLDFCRKHKRQYYHADQTPLNFIFWNKTKFISAEFNLFGFYIPLKEPDKTIIHFNNPIKPWSAISDETYIPVYDEIFKEILFRLKLDTLKKSSVKEWIKFRLKKHIHFILIFFYKIKKLINILLRNTDKVKDSENNIRATINFNLLKKDEKLIAVQNIFRSNWLEKIKLLDNVDLD